MWSKLTPVQRRLGLSVNLIAVLLIVLGISLIVLDDTSPIAMIGAGLAVMGGVLDWTWRGLGSTPADNRQIRHLGWRGLGFIGAAGGWWLVIGIIQAPFLVGIAGLFGIMGVGYLIASGIRLWQVRQRGIR